MTRLLALVPLAALLLAAPPARALSPADLDLLDRVTWGANEPSAAQFTALGRDKWLDRQLHPTAADTLPPAAQAAIDALPIARTSMPDLLAAMQAQNKAAGALADPAEKQRAQSAYQQALTDLARQGATRQILRDLYSPAQLREQMTWFWFNHFNVHQYKSDIRAMVADYEDTAIRPHALGRFRDLLGATLRHPAMLRYLDNAENYAGHLNENYAREIMELHTMGVGGGYTQHDVEELARILTGLTIDRNPTDPRLKPELQPQLVRAGLFEFNPARHDYGDKQFLGQTIKGRGLAEVDQVLDLLARQPATARRLSRRLAVFFVADAPPPALIEAMAQSYLRADGDIAAVLKTLFRAPEFAASAGKRFKDPVHYVFSAVRLAYGERVIRNTTPVQNWLNRMAEGIYNHETPDGFALDSQAWNGPGQLAVRFEIARQIGTGSAGLFKIDTSDQPGFPQLQNALYYDSLRLRLGPRTRAALDQATSPQDWNFLYLCSPEFMF